MISVSWLAAERGVAEGESRIPGYFPVTCFCSRFGATKFPVRPKPEERRKHLTGKGLSAMIRRILREKSIFFPVFPAEPGKFRYAAAVR
jgi:hypothetical protein